MIVKNKNIRLWTIQQPDFLKQLKKNGFVSPQQVHVLDPEHEFGYQWMMQKMDQKIAIRPYPNSTPIWAWAQWNGTQAPKPDLRYAGYLEKGTPALRIEFEVPIHQVLLSDFDLWHFPYAYQFLIPQNETENTEFNTVLEALNLSNKPFFQLPYHLKMRIVDSWAHIFNLNFDNTNYTQQQEKKSFQATLWTLQAKTIRRIDHFIAR